MWFFRYLSLIKTKCGFDPKFFELLEMSFAAKTESQRHGVLLVDEMSVRESVNVTSENLTYTGLVDFGDNADHDFKETADHGLVFLFQPLYDDYAQPVAVFASRGPVDGLTLAQLITKGIYIMQYNFDDFLFLFNHKYTFHPGILLLEDAGALVHGVVGDGATPNRKFWDHVGVSGRLGEEQ